MWFDSEIEAPAVHAYHNDPWTEEDFEIMELTQHQDSDDGPGIQIGRLRRSSVMYEGGDDQ